MIPLCDLKRQYQALKTEIDAAMQEAAAGTHYILGPQVRELERAVAAYCGCEFAVGVGNGTDALHLALRALRIGPGDEVITTPFTFIATTEAIGIVGATPVFVDVDADTFNLDPARLESAITPRTKAIIPVHLFGQPCDMAPIMEIARARDVRVVEDCAQAMGAEYRGQRAGSFGAAGCLSFFPSKNLGAFGDGGMVVTNDREVYERVEMLRRHGGRVKYHHSELGLNSRLDELQAAILGVKLPHLDRWNELRRAAALYYNERLSTIPGVRVPRELSAAGSVVPTPSAPGDGLLRAVYHQYTVLVENRDAVLAHLQERKVGSAVYYPVPLHLQEVHADMGMDRGAFPHAEHAADHCLSLPMFPEITRQEQDQVADALRSVAAVGGVAAG